MKIQNRSKNRPFRGLARGFSLFEMVIVMGIIGVILGGAIYSMGKIGESARITAVDGNFVSLKNGLEAYRTNGRRYPSQQQGLEALIEKPSSSPQPKRWSQILDDPDKLIDPWDTKYEYKYPGSKDPSSPEIISAGPDKQFGTDDDLSSQD